MSLPITRRFTGDPGMLREMLQLSDEILLQNDTVLGETGWVPGKQLDIGTFGLCAESSDAVTRAAQSMGIIAAREVLGTAHCIT